MACVQVDRYRIAGSTSAPTSSGAARRRAGRPRHRRGPPGALRAQTRVGVSRRRPFATSRWSPDRLGRDDGILDQAQVAEARQVDAFARRQPLPEQARRLLRHRQIVLADEDECLGLDSSELLPRLRVRDERSQRSIGELGPGVSVDHPAEPFSDVRAPLDALEDVRRRLHPQRRQPRAWTDRGVGHRDLDVATTDGVVLRAARDRRRRQHDGVEHARLLDRQLQGHESAERERDQMADVVPSGQRAQAPREVRKAPRPGRIGREPPCPGRSTPMWEYSGRCSQRRPRYSSPSCSRGATGRRPRPPPRLSQRCRLRAPRGGRVLRRRYATKRSQKERKAITGRSAPVVVRRRARHQVLPDDRVLLERPPAVLQQADDAFLRRRPAVRPGGHRQRDADHAGAVRGGGCGGEDHVRVVRVPQLAGDERRAEDVRAEAGLPGPVRAAALPLPRAGHLEDGFDGELPRRGIVHVELRAGGEAVDGGEVVGIEDVLDHEFGRDVAAEEEPAHEVVGPARGARERR